MMDDSKTEMLTEVLAQRYEFTRKMRSRSFDFSKWVWGLGLAFIFFILKEEKNLDLYQRVMFTAFDVFMIALSIRFLMPMERGFDKNMKIVSRLERALGLFEKGKYLKSEAILPEDYGMGTRQDDYSRKPTSHFLSLYWWLIGLGGALLIAIWTKPILLYVVKSIARVSQQGE